MTPDNDKPTTPPLDQPEALADAPRPAGVLRGNTGIDTAQGIIAAFLAGMVALLALFAGVGAPFHGPDLDLFSDPESLSRVAWVPDQFDDLPHAPLTLFSYALNRQLFGASPAALQTGNLILLAAGVALCLLWLRAVFAAAPVALLLGVALLVGLHPMSAAGVGVAVGRPALLGAFFGHLALCLLLRSPARAEGNAATIAGIAAYLAATAAYLPWLILPMLLLALDWTRGGPGGWRQRLPVHGVLFALLLAIVVARRAAFADAWPAWPVADAPWAWLARLATLQGYWPDNAGMVWGGGSVAIVLGLAVAGLAFAARGAALGAALAWIGLGLLAEAVLSPVAPGTGVLPLIGVGVAVVAGATLLPPGVARNVAGAALAAVVIAAGGLSYVQATAWNDPLGYWSVQAATPGNTAALRRLGEYLAHEARHGEDETARTEARRAGIDVWRGIVATTPGDGAAAGVLGGLLLLDGQGAEAEPLLRQAVAADPFNPAHALNLALALERWVTLRDGRIVPPTQRPTPEDLDRQRRALDYFARAAALGPLPREAQVRYGFTLAMLGDRESGLPLLRAALGDDPAMAPLLQQFEEAIREAAALEAAAQQAFAAGTPTPEARFQRALANLRHERLVPARYGLQQLARDPEQAAAWVQLGLLSQRLEELGAFLGEFGPAQNENAALWTELAARLATLGQWDAAEATLRACEASVPGADPALGSLAEIALALGQTERAVAHLNALAEARPEDPAPWARLAAISEAAGNAADATRYAAEAAQRGGSATLPTAETPDEAAPPESESPRRAIERTVIR